MNINDVATSYENIVAKIVSTNVKDSKCEKEDYAKDLTFIPWEDMRIEESMGKDGKSFRVISYEKVKGEKLNKEYSDVFLIKAQGKEEKYHDFYVNNFISEITKNLSDSTSLKEDIKALEKGVEDLVDEMRQNISKGISNDIEKLKTKFSVNGVDFTFKELMDSTKVMDYARSILIVPGGDINYNDYAEMGIAKGKVITYAKNNLNESQQKLLNSSIAAKIQNVIDSEHKFADIVYKNGLQRDDAKKFYGIKNVQSATNKEYAKMIMDKFATVDYADKKDFEEVIKEYKSIIKPVLEEYGVKDTTNNQCLTELINYQIDKFTSLFDESYKNTILSVSEVRKMFGNAECFIDTCR